MLLTWVRVLLSLSGGSESKSTFFMVHVISNYLSYPILLSLIATVVYTYHIYNWNGLPAGDSYFIFYATLNIAIAIFGFKTLPDAVRLVDPSWSKIESGKYLLPSIFYLVGLLKWSAGVDTEKEVNLEEEEEGAFIYMCLEEIDDDGRYIIISF